jgi:hypothetical protein
MKKNARVGQIGGTHMLVLSVISIMLANTALLITAWPHVRAIWEKYSREARLQRRIAMLKTL